MDSFIQGAIKASEEHSQEEQAQSQQFQKVQEEPKQVTIKTAQESKRQQDTEDDELEELLSNQKAQIKVIGCGGGGCNTVNRISEVGIVGAETIAVNTDAQDLLYTQADRKVLIGRDLTKGLGAGGKPQVGAESAKENEKELRTIMAGSDMVFITSGMGGGTGTGSATVIADIAKKAGALTIAVVTTPFKMEGGRRLENAIFGLEELEKTVDTLIIVPNDKLMNIAQDLPLQTAFKVADEILTNAVKGMAELVTKAGLVNLDFADIRAVMGDGGVALIGVGESDSDNRAGEAVDKAISNPLLDVDISGAEGALINVAGGSDLRLDEANIIVDAITARLDPQARIIWGAQISEDLEGTVRVMLVVTGVQSSQYLGKDNGEVQKRVGKRTLGNDLGIEFV